MSAGMLEEPPSASFPEHTGKVSVKKKAGLTRLKSDTAGIEALTFVRRDTLLRLTMWTEVVKMSTRRMKSSQL
ncbi:hypothetical protein NQZ68_014959 [Dissostichus eleginoides]|nr:hypothetical protein NQZ68_014959 [Dissostichus eleginoides]